MQVKKIHLAHLPWVYAITLIDCQGRRCCLAASELEGKGGDCLLIDAETYAVHTVWDGPGGVMSLIPVPGQTGAFLSIDEFYPVFKSENASINRTFLRFADGALQVEKEELCKLPYTHRITVLQEPDGLFLAAANLCASKQFVEDWSDPGGVHIGTYGSGAPLETVYQGLTKNHGMYTQTRPEGDILWIGAQEGILRCERRDGAWHSEFVLREETSDMWLADLDGDGEEELAVIQGFHGDTASILKKIDGSYQKVVTIPINFGHVVWCGDVLGQPSLITASRGGEMELALHAVNVVDGQFHLPTQILEKGVGATQIAVDAGEQEVRVYAANHETGDVVLYLLSR
ncbi:MAG: hypothetical protein IJ751_00815 [Oscillospiraceae bacterium]|nr:hypothetical protein [Oscillospiraceae bacterium]